MMTNRYKKGFLLLTAPVWILVLCFIASCGKSTNITGANTQLQIINLSSDLGPVNLFINSVKQSLTTYTYTNNSGYFFLNSLTPPIQFRTANAAAISIPYQIDTVLRSNSKYTLFITGYAKDTTIKNSVLSLDTATLPAIGRAKVRFANFSPSSPDLDIKANDTLMVFEPKKLGRKFNSISPYLSLPTGNYNFTINAHSTPTKVEITLKSVTIQDGRAYTIYTQGIVGRTDSVAFGAAVLTNNLLIKATQ